MECPNNVKVWFGSNLTLRFSDQPNQSFQDWLLDTIIHKDNDTIIRTATIIYHIWFVRNLRVFEDRMLPEEAIFKQAEQSIHDFQLTSVSEPYRSDLSSHLPRSINRPVRNSIWTKPPAGLFKANSDTNLQILDSWCLGAIIRDEAGLVLAAATWTTQGCDDVLLAETYGLLVTMRLCIDCGFKRR